LTKRQPNSLVGSLTGSHVVSQTDRQTDRQEVLLSNRYTLGLSERQSCRHFKLTKRQLNSLAAIKISSHVVREKDGQTGRLIVKQIRTSIVRETVM
jgi:hypothetical protein